MPTLKWLFAIFYFRKTNVFLYYGKSMSVVLPPPPPQTNQKWNFKRNIRDKSMGKFSDRI